MCISIKKNRKKIKRKFYFSFIFWKWSIFKRQMAGEFRWWGFSDCWWLLPSLPGYVEKALLRIGCQLSNVTLTNKPSVKLFNSIVTQPLIFRKAFHFNLNWFGKNISRFVSFEREIIIHRLIFIILNHFMVGKYNFARKSEILIYMKQ